MYFLRRLAPSGELHGMTDMSKDKKSLKFEFKALAAAYLFI
jgi:hypothetical protein